MTKLRFIVLAASAVTLAATGAGAQSVPPGQMPPAGLCRVWIDGVPPGRQARPTDCTTARRSAPANAHILYGGDARLRNGTANGQYDARRDPRSASYDPRYGQHTTNGTYDPRYGTNSGNVNDPRYGHTGTTNNGTYDPRYDRNGTTTNGTYDGHESQKDREKWEKKHDKQREKAERKNHKDRDRDGDHDRDRDDDHRDR